MWKFGSNSVGLLVVVAATVSIPGCYAAAGPQVVGMIRQGLKDKMASSVVHQIHDYAKSVLFYKSYASYFDRADVNLPGFKKFFQKLSEERIDTADNLTAILNERGGHVTFQNIKLRQLCTVLSRKLGRFPHVCFFVIDEPANQKTHHSKHKKGKPLKHSHNYKQEMTKRTEENVTPKMPTGLSALEDCLSLEKSTNKDLIDLMAVAIKLKDPAMRVKLDAHLERQVDIIYNVFNLVTRLRLYKDGDNYALGEYILDSELTY